MVKDINVGSNGAVLIFYGELNGKLLFTATYGNEHQLYKSDGTESGTTMIKDGFLPLYEM